MPGLYGTSKIEKGESASLNANAFSRDGYVFTGWNTAKDGSGEAYANGATIKPSSNITLYGQWKEDFSKAVVQISKSTYNEKEQTPEITVYVNNNLVSADNYDIRMNKKPIDAGSYPVTITAKGSIYSGSTSGTFIINKAKNTLKINKAKRTIKATLNAKTKKTTEKKTVTGVKIIDKGQGKLTYKKVKVNKSKAQFSVNSKTGNITIKKGTKSGTYKVTVAATAAGDNNYKNTTKKAVVTIIVKSK